MIQAGTVIHDQPRDPDLLGPQPTGEKGHINHSTKRTALMGLEPHLIDVSSDN